MRRPPDLERLLSTFREQKRAAAIRQDNAVSDLLAGDALMLAARGGSIAGVGLLMLGAVVTASRGSLLHIEGISLLGKDNDHGEAGGGDNCGRPMIDGADRRKPRKRADPDTDGDYLRRWNVLGALAIGGDCESAP